MCEKPAKSAAMRSALPCRAIPAEIANRQQLVPREWINKQGNDVTDEMFEYLLPLIEGEVPYPTQNGMPVHFVLNQSIVE